MDTGSTTGRVDGRLAVQVMSSRSVWTVSLSLVPVPADQFVGQLIHHVLFRPNGMKMATSVQRSISRTKQARRILIHDPIRSNRTNCKLDLLHPICIASMVGSTCPHQWMHPLMPNKNLLHINQSFSCRTCTRASSFREPQFVHSLLCSSMEKLAWRIEI